MSKDGCGSMYTDARRSIHTDVSTDSMGMHGSTCPYITTKYTVIHGVTYMDDSMIKAVVRGRMTAYGKFGRYKPKWDIGTDVVGKICKGISYADAL